MKLDEQQVAVLLEQIPVGAAHRLERVLPALAAAAAASWKVAFIRRLVSSLAATKSSSLLGKSRNRYACEIPASRAISVVGAP